MWRRTQWKLPSVVLASCVLLVTCDPSSVAPTGGDATLIVRADVSATSVATVVVAVTAPDIPAALVFNIPVSGGVASGPITIPAGSNRAIALQAFDAGGVETHSGSVTLNVQPTTNQTIAIVLQPLTGDLPIVLTLGSVIVAVSPSAASLTVGGTVRLAASLTSWTGSPTTGTVVWATSNPGVAVVDGGGLVTAKGVGSAAIVATYQGAAGTATITVGP